MGFSSTEKALQMAREQREKAYSPYSKFSVGAVVKMKDNDHLYVGSNIENASFGATVCAERVAVWKAISEKPKSKIDAMLLVTGSAHFDPPCGMCLQVISEFSDADTEIIMANLNGVQKIARLYELLPERFQLQR